MDCCRVTELLLPSRRDISPCTRRELLSIPDIKSFRSHTTTAKCTLTNSVTISFVSLPMIHGSTWRIPKWSIFLSRQNTALSIRVANWRRYMRYVRNMACFCLLTGLVWDMDWPLRRRTSTCQPWRNYATCSISEERKSALYAAKRWSSPKATRLNHYSPSSNSMEPSWLKGGFWESSLTLCLPTTSISVSANMQLIWR